MGQQQLLLIVLGVIIVGIAVVVGINVFTASSTSANRDAVVSDLTNLASMAQQFYRKPTALGGGGNSFKDASGTLWAPPPNLEQTPNMSEKVKVSLDDATGEITLVGKGTEIGNDGSAVVQVTMVVGPNEFSTTINN